MFLIVFAASAKAFFVASSQLFGELPISSIIFTTVMSFASPRWVIPSCLYVELEFNFFVSVASARASGVRVFFYSISCRSPMHVIGNGLFWVVFFEVKLKLGVS